MLNTVQFMYQICFDMINLCELAFEFFILKKIQAWKEHELEEQKQKKTH